MLEKVLIVEDEAHARTGLTELVAAWGFRAEGAADGAEGLDRIRQWSPGIVVTDLKMPRMDGMELLARIRELPDRPVVIMLTAQGSIESAVEAMRMGAYDYVPKPIDPVRLKAILQSANTQREVDASKQAEPARKPSEAAELGPLVGSSPQMRAIYQMVERVAPSNVSVLVTGESGTGKELAARAIHMLSPRKAGPFVAINCAALPDSLMESELFGHEKGAFTGAVERRAGAFELAQNGTVLLDEIGDMPIATQAKLLRVLEDGRVRRLGGKNEIQLDVRVIAATNTSLDSAIKENKFREDLYYRLNVFPIPLPALRERKDDLPILAQALLEDLNHKHATKVTELSGEVLDRFQTYDWPGNVRELRNVLERAVILAGEGTIQMAHLPPGFSGTPASSGTIASDQGDLHIRVGQTIEQAERALIEVTLEHTKNNKTRAAEILGISQKTLFNKLKEYGTQGAGA